MRAFLIILLLVIAGGAGCQKPPSAGEKTASQPAKKKTSKSAPSSAQNRPEDDNESTDPETPRAGQETKWIGKIPYDVFYDQPLEVAANATPVVGASPPTTAVVAKTPNESPMTPNPAEAPAENTTGASDPPPTDGAIDYATIAPLDLVLDQVKVQRTQLEAYLLKPGDYNKHLIEIQLDAVVLAGLAAVVERHPEPANWQPHAKSLRDLANQVNASATETGNKAFTATKGAFEQIKSILEGGKPTESTAKDKVPYGECLDRYDTMKWLQAEYNSVRSNINTEARMKEDKPAVIRQLTTIGLLFAVMGDDSYDSGDNPDYQAFIDLIVKDCREGIQAVESDNFDQFSSAVLRINNTCTECHTKFKDGE